MAPNFSCVPDLRQLRPYRGPYDVPMRENPILDDRFLNWIKKEPIRIHKYHDELISRMTFRQFSLLNDSNFEKIYSQLGRPTLTTGARGKILKISKQMATRHAVLAKCLNAIESSQVTESIVTDRIINQLKEILGTPLDSIMSPPLPPIVFRLFLEVSNQFNMSSDLAKGHLAFSLLAVCDMIASNGYFSPQEQGVANAMKKEVSRFKSLAYEHGVKPFSHQNLVEDVYDVTADQRIAKNQEYLEKLKAQSTNLQPSFWKVLYCCKKC